jgi:hypothetical protein
MIRRALLGLALVGAAFAGLDCNQIFGLKELGALRPAEFFEGCFSGPVTEPAGQGDLTIILVAPPEATASLEGCMQSTNPPFVATVAGFANEEDFSQALVTVMPQGRPAFAVAMERKPPDVGEAALTMTLINESGFPFERAQDLPRCPAETTCADLGIPVPFLPGGAP